MLILHSAVVAVLALPQFWAGKRVIITGASSGLGAALASELSSRGATLVLAARRAPKLAEVVDACEGKATPLVLDACAPPEQLEARAAEATALLGGRCDVLCCCAGLGQRSDAVETSAEAHARIMGANFEGAVSLTRALLPPMLARGDGAIVVVSSVQGFFGQPGRSSYAAAKVTWHLTPTPCTSHLAPRTSHLSPHTVHLTPHTSHLAPRTSHLAPHVHAQGAMINYFDAYVHVHVHAHVHVRQLL